MFPAQRKSSKRWSRMQDVSCGTLSVGANRCAKALMFPVEHLRAIGWIPSKLFHVEQIATVRAAPCSTWNMHHHIFVGTEGLIADDFLLPTNRSLRREWGTGIGSCHSHVWMVWISGRS